MNLSSSDNFRDINLVKKENFICSIYLTGGKKYGHFPLVQDINHIRVWAESLKANGITGVMFHNSFSRSEIATFSDLPVKFIQVTFNRKYMSGLYRFELYHKFINQFKNYIDSIFFTDSTDLDVLRNPFTDEAFDRSKIYIGYEPVIKGNKWMIDSCRGVHMFKNLLKSDQAFFNSPLLNAGLIGGSLESVTPFIKRMYEECSKMYPVSYVQDMPILNYLAYVEFKDKVYFGKRVNTVFTAYEQDNKTAWFKHK